MLDVSDLRVQFRSRGRVVNAVQGVSFTVEPGRTLAIIGESGSGKTVSAYAVLGLLPRTAQVSGSIRFDGIELVGRGEKDLREHRGRNAAMVFQDPERSLNPTMRIGTQITEAIKTHLPLGRAEAHERAVELLRMVRLPTPERRFYEYPHQLSGGMRQRVVIAIALACEPRLLIADEATTALDVTTQAQIMDLLLGLQQELGTALVMISHDLALAASYAEEVLVMYAGRVVERAAAGGPVLSCSDAVHARPAERHPAGRAGTACAAPGDRRAAAGPVHDRPRMFLRAALSRRTAGLPAPEPTARAARVRPLVGVLASVRKGRRPVTATPAGADTTAADATGAGATAGTAGSDALLEVRHLVQEFVLRDYGGVKGGVLQAVSDVSFDLHAGETLGIVGETGSGKSTLARSVIQAPPPKHGQVIFEGQDLVGLPQPGHEVGPP